MTTSSLFLMWALHTPNLISPDGKPPVNIPTLHTCLWYHRWLLPLALPMQLLLTDSQCSNSHCALTHHPLWPNPTWRTTLLSSRLQPHLLQQGPNPSFGEGHSSKFVCSWCTVTVLRYYLEFSLYIYICYSLLQ